MALSYRIPLELSLPSKDIFLLDDATLFDHLAPLSSSYSALGLSTTDSRLNINQSTKNNGKSQNRIVVSDLVGMMALPCATQEDDFVLFPSHETDSSCTSSHFSDDFVEEARVLINQLADAPIDVTNGSPSSPARDAEAFDCTLQSPLGLSDLTFPFDYSPLNEYLLSPLFSAADSSDTFDTSDTSEDSATPDLVHSSLGMNLFAPSPTPGLVDSSEDSIVEEVKQVEMDEDYTEEVKEEIEEESPPKEITTRSSTRKAKSAVLEPGARSQSGKRLFNGTRSTAFEIVTLDAPIQKRNFSTPSRTSRKRLPKAVERSLPPAKRQRLKVKVEDGEYDEKENAEELPVAVEDLVERKRKENTLAARVSRQRKKENLDALLAENAGLKEDNAELRKENEKLRKQLGME